MPCKCYGINRGIVTSRDGHGKQILKGNQKKLASLCTTPPPAQDMVKTSK